MTGHPRPAPPALFFFVTASLGADTSSWTDLLAAGPRGQIKSRKHSVVQGSPLFFPRQTNLAPPPTRQISTRTLHNGSNVGLPLLSVKQGGERHLAYNRIKGAAPKAPRVAHSLSPAFPEPLGSRSKATGRFPEVHPGHTAKPAALISRLLGSHASLAETCLPGRGPAPPLSYLPWKPAPALTHLG